MSTKNEKRAEALFDAELIRLAEEVRWAAAALQRAQERMKQHADNHDGFVAYKSAMLDLTGKT